MESLGRMTHNNIIKTIITRNGNLGYFIILGYKANTKTYNKNLLVVIQKINKQIKKKLAYQF